jgi:hypothetical protein
MAKLLLFKLPKTTSILGRIPAKGTTPKRFRLLLGQVRTCSTRPGSAGRLLVQYIDSPTGSCGPV